MIFKVFGVLQFISIQVISSQISARDLASQNVLNNLVNTPLAEYGRSRRQVVDPPVDLPENGNLPVNGLANGLPFKNGMPFGNIPRNNGLRNHFGFNNGFPNNSPISSLNFPFSNMNALPQNRLLPNIWQLHNINGIINNGLPFNNIPNGLPGLNNVPNGLPDFNNVPNRLPGLNNVPNGYVPNGLSGLNNVPNGLPGFNNVPNRLPGLNNVPNGLPGLNNVPNGLPGLNNVPNGLPNFSNLPVTNKFQNLINVPAGTNILDLNNLPTSFSLPNINNIPNPIGLSSLNNLPCGSSLPSLPVSNRVPQNNQPNGNMLPPNSNKLPFLNDFRITEIGIGDRVADLIRFPRNNEPGGNAPLNTNMFQNGNGLTQQENYQSNNGYSEIMSTPPARFSPTILPVETRFSSVNHFPISSIVANEAQNMPQNFQNCNLTPVNEQNLINNAPANNDFVVANNFPANANNRLVNTMNNGMPLSNGGYLNDIMFANNGMPETYVQNDNGFSGNNLQFGNVQVPVNDWRSELGYLEMPSNQNVLLEGMQMLSNLPNDYQTSLMPNNLSLAQELVKNLQIEGLPNMLFLNGLPVAGITETVTVLNGPYGK